MRNSTVLYGKFGTGESSHPDKTADLDHVGQDSVLAAAQVLHAFNGEQVGADAADLGPHLVEHGTELIQIGFASGIEDGRGAVSHHSRHHHVGGTRHRGLA